MESPGKATTSNVLEKVTSLRLIQQRLNLGDGFKRSQGNTLFQLFSNYEDVECVDQRDKIFGLYSLAPDCCQEANTIGYSLTWQEVLKRLVCHQIHFHYSLPKGITGSCPQELTVAKFRNFYSQAKLFSSSANTSTANEIIVKPDLELL
jgi:hypothetical protein